MTLPQRSETVPRAEAVEMYRVLQALVARLGTKQIDRGLLNEACEALDAFRKVTR